MFCEANSFNSYNSMSLTYNPRIMPYFFSSQNVTKFFPLWWEVGGAKNLFSLFSFSSFSATSWRGYLFSLHSELFNQILNWHVQTILWKTLERQKEPQRIKGYDNWSRERWR